jgi:2-oxoglutarate dehydrogenase E2 component (dihydrolipoamide succinyltransferase)
MSMAVALPELGESVVEGTVSRWLVAEGDRVQLDQPLVEVTTDKVDAEIPSPATGVVEKILVAEGDTLAVGEALAMLAIESETSQPAEDERAAPLSIPLEKPAAASRPEAGAQRAPAREALAGDPSLRLGSGERSRTTGPRATPVARRLAAESQVDLRAVEGTGPSGRVTKSDLARHTAARTEAPQPRPAPERGERPAPERGERPAYLNYALQPGDRVIPMSPLRRLVAEHMVMSKRVSPHVGTVAEIDMGGVARVRDAHKNDFRESYGFGLSYLPFVAAATVHALREYPQLNASVLEEAIVEKNDIHMGVAVETDKGLIVPVVRHADRLSLAGLAQAVEDLSTRARTKRLSADELKGGTFTLSNPGRHGNLYGFAIINQPQVGILRMGEIVKRPVVVTVAGQDSVAIRPVMHLALSYDHRAVDGAPANAFLFRVRELLEEAEFDL